MTLLEFNQQVLPIIQSILAAAGLTSLFLLWGQIRQARLWNQMQHSQGFLDEKKAFDLELELLNNLERLSIDTTKLPRELCEEEVSRIAEDFRADLALRTYLNGFENLCMAVNAKVVDEDLAYTTQSVRVVSRYSTYRGFIEYCRTRFGDREVFLEIEKLAKTWKQKIEAREAELEKEREQTGAEALRSKIS